MVSRTFKIWSKIVLAVSPFSGRDLLKHTHILEGLEEAKKRRVNERNREIEEMNEVMIKCRDWG